MHHTMKVYEEFRGVFPCIATLTGCGPLKDPEVLNPPSRRPDKCSIADCLCFAASLGMDSGEKPQGCFRDLESDRLLFRYKTNSHEQ
jgi:hypothetical protein